MLSPGARALKIQRTCGKVKGGEEHNETPCRRSAVDLRSFHSRAFGKQRRKATGFQIPHGKVIGKTRVKCQALLWEPPVAVSGFSLLSWGGGVVAAFWASRLWGLKKRGGGNNIPIPSLKMLWAVEDVCCMKKEAAKKLQLRRKQRKARGVGPQHKWGGRRPLKPTPNPLFKALGCQMKRKHLEVAGEKKGRGFPLKKKSEKKVFSIFFPARETFVPHSAPQTQRQKRQPWRRHEKKEGEKPSPPAISMFECLNSACRNHGFANGRRRKECACARANARATFLHKWGILCKTQSHRKYPHTPFSQKHLGYKDRQHHGPKRL